MQRYNLFINGHTVAPTMGRYLAAHNPYTGNVWAEIPDACERDVDIAVKAALQAFVTTWQRTPGVKRAQLMLRLAELIEQNADRLSNIESTDNGKIVRETRPQMIWVGRQLRYFAGYADKLYGQHIPLDQPNTLDYLSLEPFGVVGLITAWNSPLALLANKLAPALAAGNCIVIKPSEHASASTLEFAELVHAAGFPEGVVNVITGGADTGRALVSHPDVALISFTGSPGVGAEIASIGGRRLVPVKLELGGKSPNIIFEDADIDKAVVGALAGIFGATGQTCVAGSRLLVQRSVMDQVLPPLIERAKAIKLGNPLLPTTEMGTVANKPQFERILATIERAQKAGANLVCGGKRAQGQGLESGYFIEPTIFTDVHNDSDLAQEEIFGPVLAVIPFDTEEEAIRLANGTRYGLAAGIWTRDLSRAMRVSSAMQAGSVWVNTYRAVAAQAPFGGFKQSGIGRERGEAGLHEYLTTRNVMIDFSEERRDPFSIRT